MIHKIMKIAFCLLYRKNKQKYQHKKANIKKKGKFYCVVSERDNHNVHEHKLQNISLHNCFAIM